MEKRCVVNVTRPAEKQLRKVPTFIREAVYIWAASVEDSGMRKVRLLPGYHDEPLAGIRRGQRSVRLNRAYRLIYQEQDNGQINVIMVLEIHKHDY